MNSKSIWIHYLYVYEQIYEIIIVISFLHELALNVFEFMVQTSYFVYEFICPMISNRYEGLQRLQMIYFNKATVTLWQTWNFKLIDFELWIMIELRSISDIFWQ